MQKPSFNSSSIKCFNNETLELCVMAFCLKLRVPSNTPRRNPLRGPDRQRHSGGKPSQTGHARRRAHAAESSNNPVFPWSAERISEGYTEIALYFARGEL